MAAVATKIDPCAEAPSPKPTELLQTQWSTLYANLHPVLLLSILLVNFKTLVNGPVNALLALAPITGALQAAYCILCLPSTGQNPPSSKPGQGQKKSSAGKSSKKGAGGQQGQDIWARIIVRTPHPSPSCFLQTNPLTTKHRHQQPAFLSFTLTLLLSTPLLYIITILFGAPLVSQHPHTLLLALHLALLTTPQLFYAHGLEAETWLRIASLQLPVDEVYGMGLGACAGAWVGAIPIPLDWDRDWQRWPVTVVVGLYVGAVVGKVAGGFLFQGWRIQMR
jgi:GPI ethanolamine phosphate transferase 2/3 subunit F